MSKTVVNILQSWTLLEDDEDREALHAAAFLLIPGLVRVCSITNERPVDLLNEAAAVNNPVMFLINKARDYVRDGLLARPDHDETNRSPAQLKRQVDTLVAQQWRWWSACMRQRPVLLVFPTKSNGSRSRDCILQRTHATSWVTCRMAVPTSRLPLRRT